MTQPFKAKPPRLPLVFQRDSPPVYFVTFCTIHRRKVLANDPVHRAFRAYAEAGAASANVAVGRYVIMTDHVHLFVQGDDGFDLGLWIRGLKRFMSRGVEIALGSNAAVGASTAPGLNVAAGLDTVGVAAAVHGGIPRVPQPPTTPKPRPASPKLWQPGFFDHLLRSEESYEQKWRYVRENPVRAGLASRAEDWPYQGEVVLIDRV
jgi:REP element-mobilizing transposase RayT